MKQSRILGFIFTLFFIFMFQKNMEAAISTVSQNMETTTHSAISKNKKVKKGSRLWEKVKTKFTKFKDKAKSKRRFGSLGVLAYIIGLVLSAALPWLFIFGSLACMAFGTLGLIHDEKKGMATIALALPIFMLLLVFGLLILTLSAA